MKVKDWSVDGHTQLAIVCPGCGNLHIFDSRWKFNGNYREPTFTPSLLCDKDDPERRCHSFVTNGKIKFLRDCHHKLRGKEVELPDIDKWMQEERKK